MQTVQDSSASGSETTSVSFGGTSIRFEREDHRARRASGMRQQLKATDCSGVAVTCRIMPLNKYRHIRPTQYTYNDQVTDIYKALQSYWHRMQSVITVMPSFFFCCCRQDCANSSSSRSMSCTSHQDHHHGDSTVPPDSEMNSQLYAYVQNVRMCFGAAVINDLNVKLLS